MQKNIFLSSEGNAWYRRNKSYLETLEPNNDAIFELLLERNIRPKRVLEIGCANGRRLNNIQKVFNCECFGIDVSDEAIEDGKTNFPNVALNVAFAESLNYENDFFDVIIFGFCLYVCDREKLFKIAAEADRILKNKGVIIIKDFCPPFPYKNKYEHSKNMYSYKMDYCSMFTWNPAYTLTSSKVMAHNNTTEIELVDERVSLSLIFKNMDTAYQNTPDFS